MPNAVTRYVALLTGKVYQINNVTAIAISSPSVTDGTYRDSPPTVVGGAAAFDASPVLSVAGGTTQTIGGGPSVSITADASVVQDDQFTHTAPRDYTSKVALLVFTTSDGIATYDCFFKLAEVAGVFNSAPPGWPGANS